MFSLKGKEILLHSFKLPDGVKWYCQGSKYFFQIKGGFIAYLIKLGDWEKPSFKFGITFSGKESSKEFQEKVKASIKEFDRELKAHSADVIPNIEEHKCGALNC